MEVQGRRNFQAHMRAQDCRNRKAHIMMHLCHGEAMHSGACMQGVMEVCKEMQGRRSRRALIKVQEPKRLKGARVSWGWKDAGITEHSRRCKVAGTAKHHGELKRLKGAQVSWGWKVAGTAKHTHKGA
eukprot:scaffold46731_cov23-Tisochrysis_lutea.AAC.4